MVKGLAYSSVRRGRGVRYRFDLEASPPIIPYSSNLQEELRII